MAEYLPELQKNMGALLSREVDSVYAQEIRITTKQGEIRNAEVHSTHTMYRGKEAVIGTFLDVTERKASEEALRWKTAFLEALLDVSLDGVLVVDGPGNISSTTSAPSIYGKSRGGSQTGKTVGRGFVMS